MMDTNLKEIVKAVLIIDVFCLALIFCFRDEPTVLAMMVEAVIFPAMTVIVAVFVGLKKLLDRIWP